MNWEMFYLICFVAGLMLSVVALLGGMGHLHFGGHVHVHLPHSVAGAAHGVSSAAQMKVPWWNGFSVMIFICWFGASGYLLTRYGGFVTGVVLTLACVCGVAGGAIVFLFLTRVLLPHDRELTADETAVVGAVGRVSAAIRQDGTGEIVYQQLGALRSAPARSEDGRPISKQEEVFVMRYEKGIAYVRRWEEVDAGTKGLGD